MLKKQRKKQEESNFEAEEAMEGAKRVKYKAEVAKSEAVKSKQII